MNSDAIVDGLRQNIGQLLDSVSFLLQGKFVGPALVVIYSTIDDLSWLDRPATKADSDCADFIQWVDRYLLPDHDFNVDAMDLSMLRVARSSIRTHRFPISAER